MRHRVARTPFKAGAAVAVVGGLLVACSSSSTDTPKASSPTASSAKTSNGSAATTVSLKLLQFVPAKLTVKAGTTVTWRSDEDITHTVTSGTYAGTNGPSGLRTSEKPSGLFNHKLGQKGASTSYTFAKPGTFQYYCDIHKGMNATVVVTP